LRKILESKTPKNLVKDLALDYMSANELEWWLMESVVFDQFHMMRPYLPSK
jgi:hypothetical protein